MNRSSLKILGLASIPALIVAYLLFAPSRKTVSSAPPAVQEPALRVPAQNTLTPGSAGSPGFLATQALCRNAFQAVCKKKGITRDPTGIVRPDFEGELMALQAYETIVRENPDWNSQQVDEEFVRHIYTPARRERVESGYRWVQKTLISILESQPETVFTAKEKKTLKARIHQTALDFPIPVARYADEPDLLTKNDVFYERLHDGRMRLRIGGAYFLSAKSWFNMIFTLAHELAHAIDPCETRSSRQAFPAYDKVTACFLQSRLIATRKTRAECGRNDQLSETFADWVAVQISARALASFAAEYREAQDRQIQLVNAAINSVRDLCQEEDDWNEEDLSVHPSAEVRINQIFGSNPEIRRILGCTTPPEVLRYCTFQ